MADYDLTDILEEKGQTLQFYQTFAGIDVSFKAFLTQYSESFACNWSAESIYGRPDPIQSFNGTSRSLTLAWKVPAFSQEDAESNLIKTSTLARMLYPEYTSVDNSNTISKAPLIKLKFANLIYDASRGPGGDVRTSGLLGVIKSYSWAPVIEEGFFDPGNQLFPKLITLSIGFDVLHQHSLGWEKQQAVPLSDERRDKLGDKASAIDERRASNAKTASPVWGPDANLFPWSAAVSRANTRIAIDNTVGSTNEQVAAAAVNNVTGMENNNE